MGANPTRERAHLSAEMMDRATAERSMMNGDMDSYTMYSNRANWNAYQADKVHYNRYAKGKTFAPYAAHASTYGPSVGPSTGFAMPAALPGTWGMAPTVTQGMTMTGRPTMMGLGAVTPGYTTNTVAGAYGTMIQNVAVQTAVPVGVQNVDMCVPVTAGSPLAPVMASGAFMPANYGANYW